MTKSLSRGLNLIFILALLGCVLITGGFMALSYYVIQHTVWLP
jgi:hypothetical protein